MTKVLLRRSLAALATLCLLLPSLARAAEPYLVVVGIDEYKDPAIKPRAHAESDAKALYDLFTDKDCFNCSDEHIKLLLGKKDDARNSQPATRENILKAVRWALSSATVDDLVLLCWVGQGAPVADRTCYFASDSTLKNRAKDAVSAADIEQELEKVKSTRICVLLDVNFKGYKESANGSVSETGLEKLFNEFDGVKDDSDAPPKPILYLAANNGMVPSVELDKHGLFTTVVLEGLRGAADSEGGEADGLVTVDELFDWVRKELPRRAQAAAGKDQIPIWSGRSTHFPLTKNPALTEKVESRLNKLAELAKGGKIKEDIAKEGRELLSRMPRLEAQRELRKKYQQLVDGKLAVDDFLDQRRTAQEALKLPRADAESFATKVFRVVKFTHEGYVKPVQQGDLVTWAIEGLYRWVEEKLPPEISARLAKSKELSEDDLRKLLADARQHLGSREDLKGQKAVDRALDAMLHKLDHYSTYIDPEAVDEFKRMTKQFFIGVGIQIQKELVHDMIRVVTPLRGSPAYKAGVKAGDIITTVTNTVDKDGTKLTEPEVVSTKGMDTNAVVKKILGKADTPVTLTVEREGVNKPLEFTIKRGKVEVETVLGARRNDDDSWDYYLDPVNKIVYIRLTQFAMNTVRDLKAVVKDLDRAEKGINAMILDLRFNPGGYLDSAVEISDLLIDDGLIVTIRPRNGRSQEFRGESNGSKLSFPVVVLVNGFSASASEIVSACIQDHGRGIIMGERSFGKGSVQNIMPLNLGEGESELKLTTASFWRPSGKNLNKFPTSKESDDWGVVPHPDYTIKLTPTERAELANHLRNHEAIPRRDAPKKTAAPAFVDRQLDGAMQYLRNHVTAKAAAKKAG